MWCRIQRLINMKEYKIDTLISKGRLHNLHCEDDFLVYENDKFILAAVFDGCSSGRDSHFASTMHKYKLKEICNNLEEYTSIYADNVVENILRELNRKIWSLDYEVNMEMLSTVVFLFIDKSNNKYHICVAGDGCYERKFMGSEFFESVHDANGNAVWYLSTVKPVDFSDYFYNYCKWQKGILENGDEICISSDGLESFVSAFGASKNDEARKIFFDTNKCAEKYQRMPLQRLYNVVTKGKCTDVGSEVMLNGDDFTMIKIKYVEEAEDGENETK